MGGGHSDPKSVQNDGITLSGNYTGHAVTNYDNLHTGPDGNTQHATSTGAHVGVGISASIPVGLLQNLAYLDASGNVVVVPKSANGQQLLGATAPTLQNLAYLNADGKVVVVPRSANGQQLLGATAPTLQNLAYLNADGKVVVVPRSANG